MSEVKNVDGLNEGNMPVLFLMEGSRDVVRKIGICVLNMNKQDTFAKKDSCVMFTESYTSVVVNYFIMKFV